VEVKITITCRECEEELNYDFAPTYIDANGAEYVDFTDVPAMQIDHHCRAKMETPPRSLLLEALQEEAERKGKK
jgi:hypothetical protein